MASTPLGPKKPVSFWPATDKVVEPNSVETELRRVEQKVLELLPLVGSEGFKRIGDEYRVDVDYVVNEAIRRHREMAERYKAALRSPPPATATEDMREELALHGVIHKVLSDFPKTIDADASCIIRQDLYDAILSRFHLVKRAK